MNIKEKAIRKFFGNKVTAELDTINSIREGNIAHINLLLKDTRGYTWGSARFDLYNGWNSEDITSALYSSSMFSLNIGYMSFVAYKSFLDNDKDEFKLESSLDSIYRKVIKRNNDIEYKVKCYSQAREEGLTDIFNRVYGYELCQYIVKLVKELDFYSLYSDVEIVAAENIMSIIAEECVKNNIDDRDEYFKNRLKDLNPDGRTLNLVNDLYELGILELYIEQESADGQNNDN